MIDHDYGQILKNFSSVRVCGDYYKVKVKVTLFVPLGRFVRQ